MKLVTAAQMRELEQAAVAAGTSEAQLMAEAGLAVAQEAWLLLGNLDGQPITVLAGPGNNGGDALIAAQHLAEWGAVITVYLPRTAESHTERLAQLEESGAQIIAGDLDEILLEQGVGTAALVIDGLLGIGANRAIEPESPIGKTLAALGRGRRRPGAPRLIAVDVPSGMDADSGAVDALLVEPDITVTFGVPKVGMYQSPASSMLGRVQVVEIGLPTDATDAVSLELLTARWARTVVPSRPENSNKGTYGRLLVMGGSQQYVGAVKLVANAAYRAGAGLVTVAAPAPVPSLLAAAIPETTWLPLEPRDGYLSGHDAETLRHSIAQYDAAVLGPGMANRESTQAFTWALLPDLGELCQRGIVLDADALNVIAGLSDGPERVPASAVMTPHPGEMARLLGRTVAEVQAARLEACAEAARRYGCTVVLKGAHTVVAAADGQVRLCPYANPLLATAGTGDVLAGIIAGYLAQGASPFDAACLGVYLHAATAEALRGDLGEAGLLAGELADRLPGIVREVLAS